jgi:small subunit ribosomal protein S1
MSESFAELFEESLKTVDMQPGSIVTGVVIDIDNEWVTVHAGLKSEGVIPRSQFIDASGECTLSVGDEVQVALETVEDGFGETKLSREKAKRAEVWKELEAAFAAEEVVKGVINGKVKGGFTVDVNSIRAFLPGSLVDVRPVRDTAHLEGKELEFKVIKLDQKRNNVVVSRRAVMEEANSAERERCWRTCRKASRSRAWSRTSRTTVPSSTSAASTACCTSRTWPGSASSTRRRSSRSARNSKSRCSSSIASATAFPWGSSSSATIPGSRSRAAIPRAAASWPRSRTSPITAASPRSKRASKVWCTSRRWTGPTRTSIRPRSCNSATRSRSWCWISTRSVVASLSASSSASRTPGTPSPPSTSKGDRISGVIKSITDFGIFIGLDGNIDGLVHLSDISWNESGEEAVRAYKKGDEIETVILSIDPERERISLGIKQLEDDPLQQLYRRK